MEDLGLKSFYCNKKILITGNTGFKGSWLSLILQQMGADVYGFSLKPKKISNYILSDVKKEEKETLFADIKNKKKLLDFVSKIKPEIVFHLAAQPFVKESYINPYKTYETNVLGTVNLLNILKDFSFLQGILIVTSDKCYYNNDTESFFNEDSRLGGIDPYSSSKACQEIVTESFRKAFFSSSIAQIGSVRAGNVIGGGDFAKDRIVPDIVRSIKSRKPLVLRNPDNTRPWQHVFEVIVGYLKLTKLMIESPGNYDQPWNLGPDQSLNKSVKDLVEKFHFLSKKNLSVKIQQSSLHESRNLSLDTSKISRLVKYKNVLNFEESVQLTYDWYKNYIENKKMRFFSINQFHDFFKEYFN